VIWDRYSCTNQKLNYLLRSSYGRACSRWHDWRADEQLRMPSMCDSQNGRSHETPHHWAVGSSSGVPPARARKVRNPFPGSLTGVQRYRPPDLMCSPVDLRAAGSSGSPVPCWGSAGVAVGALLRLMRKHLQENRSSLWDTIVEIVARNSNRFFFRH